MSPRHILGLDVGTHTIKAAVAEVKKNGELNLVYLSKSPSAGLRRGAVHDITEATQKIGIVLSEIKKNYKDALDNIVLSVGTADVKIQPSIGVVAVSRADYEIFRDDIERAVQSSQAINLPPNRMVLHHLISEYIVDGVRDIRDPLGMIGNRLEVGSLIIDAFAPMVKNLTRCVEVLGGNLSGIILGTIAAAEAVLSRRQKELGVVVVDIGFATTGMVVYEEGKLLHTAILPFGSGHITNDLAIGLKAPIEVAEAIKLSFGSAIVKDSGSRDSIDVARIDPRLKGIVSKKLVSEIIETRLAEIFELVNNELKSIERAGKLPAGVVLVGGGAKMPGIVELAKQELKLPAQVAIPDMSKLTVVNGELGLQVEDPEYAPVLGLLLYSREINPTNRKLTNGFTNLFRKIFKYLIP